MVRGIAAGFSLLSLAGLLGLLGLAGCTSTPPELTAQDLARVEAPPAGLKAAVDARMPGDLAMVAAAEAEALARGRPLTEAETAAARQLGVRHPEKVRVLVTRDFPGDRAGLSLRQVGGFTTHYGIYVHPRFADKPWIVLHELVHVAQFERLGREGMVRRYLIETLALPGNLIPLEREAIARSEALLGRASPGYAY